MANYVRTTPEEWEEYERKMKPFYDNWQEFKYLFEGFPSDVYKGLMDATLRGNITRELLQVFAEMKKIAPEFNLRDILAEARFYTFFLQRVNKMKGTPEQKAIGLFKNIKRIVESPAFKYKFLANMWIFITGRCNLRCPHCVAANVEKEDLDFEVLKRSFEGLNNVNYIEITGGEPTLHKNFKEIVRFCSKVCRTVQIDTNAMWVSLNPAEVREQIKWLPNNCMFLVSFDRFHFGEITPDVETKIKNLIKACIEERISITLNSIGQTKKFPEVKDPELRMLLDKIQNAELEGISVVFGGKPGFAGNARSMSENSVRKYDIKNDGYLSLYKPAFGIRPDGSVYAGFRSFLSGELPNPENMTYLGDLANEPFSLIYRRQIRRAVLRGAKTEREMLARVTSNPEYIQEGKLPVSREKLKRMLLEHLAQKRSAKQKSKRYEDRLRKQHPKLFRK